VTHRPAVDRHGWPGLALAFAAILTVAGCSSPLDSGPPLARKNSWEESFNRGDAAGVAALYAPDAELVMSGEAPIRGRAAIRAAIGKMLHSGVKVRIESDRAAAAGGLAYFYGPYEVSSDRGVVERGTYLEVWHHYGERWLIELDVNATGSAIISGSARSTDRDIGDERVGALALTRARGVSPDTRRRFR
jgi:uncharacterized protein (TIGR02246 family)